MKQAITGVTSGSRSAEFWRQLMKKWEASGESQRTIAEAAGLSVHTFPLAREKPGQICKHTPQSLANNR